MSLSDYDHFSKEVFNLQPKFPKKGVTCEDYITDKYTAKSFFDWEARLEVKNSKDEAVAQFLELPRSVRQAGHRRIFGTSWEFAGTKNSMFLASKAFFEPDSSFVAANYRRCEIKVMGEKARILKQRQFLQMINA